MSATFYSSYFERQFNLQSTLLNSIKNMQLKLFKNLVPDFFCPDLSSLFYSVTTTTLPRWVFYNSVVHTKTEFGYKTYNLIIFQAKILSFYKDNLERVKSS